MTRTVVEFRMAQQWCLFGAFFDRNMRRCLLSLCWSSERWSGKSDECGAGRTSEFSQSLTTNWFKYRFRCGHREEMEIQSAIPRVYLPYIDRLVPQVCFESIDLCWKKKKKRTHVEFVVEATSWCEHQSFKKRYVMWEAWACEDATGAVISE